MLLACVRVLSTKHKKMSLDGFHKMLSSAFEDTSVNLSLNAVFLEEIS